MSVVTLTGKNVWARQSELHAVVDEFVQANGKLSLERLDGEETEFVRIQEALTSLPFLANKKMVVLNRPSASARFAEQAEVLLEELPDSTELVLVEPAFDKRSSLYKLLHKTTDWREFAPLDGPALARWLLDAAKQRGASLSSGDARYLVERVGQNQQLLSSELDKLCVYDPAISRQTIDLLTEATPQSTIFQLIEAAFAGNVQRALGLYDEQRRLKVEPQAIVAMFAWQLHLLALVKAAGQRAPRDIAADAKLSPFVVDKSLRLSRQLSLTQLRQLIDRLLTLDRRSKREALDLDDALKHYVLELGKTN